MTTPSGYVSCSATLSGVNWRRSSHSTAANNCVETARLMSGLLAVRDSKDEQGPALLFGPEAWSRFVRALCDGAFDLL